MHLLRVGVAVSDKVAHLHRVVAQHIVSLITTTSAIWKRAGPGVSRTRLGALARITPQAQHDHAKG
ncbi:endoglucanase 24-like isoform X1 [Iris pallida]|uniref:Endoglucanase 24-like isoform X1 n=1 Tax=Iris pallida TaxID=29817 RepID=A0AAX6HXD7_IRIPA|nr:endoglucanase 24-like isoform X1 [Iris pallida]